MIKVKNIAALLSLGLRIIRPKAKVFYPFRQTYFINQSKFYRPQISVQQLLNEQHIDYNQSTSGTLRIKYCPFCTKPHREDPSNLYTLSVNKTNGLYFCHRCRSGGSYLDLKKGLLGINVDPIHREFAPTFQQLPQQTISQTEYFIYKENMKKAEYQDAKDYLNSRGLTDDIIKKYSIGCGHEIFTDADGESISVKVLYFPMYKVLSAKEQRQKLIQIAENQDSNLNFVTELAKLKIRGIGKQNKKYMRQYPPGPARGIFGLNTIRKTDKVVVITEGQFDAMSVYQMTGLPALSLPQGANSMPDVILPYFDQFEKIILWMDNDEAGLMNVDKIAQKLGVSRTHIVSNTSKQCKDANDFLQKKPEMIKQLINKARTVPDQNILQFHLIRDKIKERFLNQKQFQGIQLSFMNFFNKKVKGIRPAQLTVVSGGTGSGKTTLLSQISIDLSRKKIPVLWGSFEIRNEILISNMLTQFSELNLKKHKQSFDMVADQFTELPLYYMSFHGSTNINQVLGTITYSIQKYGVNFIVIDTLQFLLSGQAEGAKKFDVQDYVMAELRKIATSFNVHIVVVIHPRKTDDNEDIGIHSIYGTSKATQQADNIWVIQNRDGFKIFDIKKNRYDGEGGRVAMGFNKQTKSFFELKKAELESLFNQEKTVHDIIQDREAQKEMNKERKVSWLEDLHDDFTDGDEPQLKRTNIKRKF